MSISDERIGELRAMFASNAEQEFRTDENRANCRDCRDALDELLHLRASSNAKAREELEAVRHLIDGMRLVGPAPIGPLFGAGWMAFHGNALKVFDTAIAALPPSPRATQGGEAADG